MLARGDALTPDEKEFVQLCIAKDPKERWSATQLLQHPYLASSSSRGNSNG
jgi:serine/threonine protein kinase